MDDRTANIAAALDGAGLQLLLALLAGPATEHDVTMSSGGISQSTVNRRLHALRDLGLVTQQRGAQHAPGRQWRVTHPRETDALLNAFLDLSEHIEDAARASREAARRELRRARRNRAGMRAADG